MKHIPNLFTLLNLLFGCIAIIYILQPGLIPLYNNSNGYVIADVNDNGTQYISISENVCVASVFIMLAAVVDFLDGFIARIFKATSAIGAQLDSFADLVSFGMAPGMIIYQFLRLAYAQQQNGLNINAVWLLPALFIPCAAAYRLARFNLDSEQKFGFKGLPTPAVGLLIASFPLIFWYGNMEWFTTLLLNKWFLYSTIILLCWLMISTLPMMALKFKNINLKQIMPFIILALISIIGAFICGWLTVPVTFVFYVLISLFIKSRLNDT